METPIGANEPLIIGAGIAGLLTALHLAPLRCHVLLPGDFPAAHQATAAPSARQPATPPDCASSLAQGGIAAAVDPADSVEAHARDTIAAGAGLADAKVVGAVTAAAPSVIETLQELGVRFDTQGDGSLRLGLEGGHSARRIVHAGDHTGAEIMRALVAAVHRAPHITVWPNTRARSLIQDGGVIQAVIVEHAGKQLTVPTSRVVLATGGLGGLFTHTTNPPTARGTGIALAARAGARLRDLEFMQFHPTALAVGGQQLPLISEAVRGEGVALVTAQGLPIMDDALATRDIVARAVWRAEQSGLQVFLATHKMSSRFSQRFPTIAARCRSLGIDPDREPIPVRVAAHYSMGGVAVDYRGRTSLAGLWAAGEVAHTGLHGANRLASNSLLEAAAYARWIADDIRAGIDGSISPSGQDWVIDVHEHLATGPITPTPPLAATALRELVSAALGVQRTEAALNSLIDTLIPAASSSDEALVALLMARAALERTTSIGAHWRSDEFEHSKLERSAS